MPSIADLEKLLNADPNDAFVLYGLAHEYAKAHDYARAVEFYDRCLGADPAYCYAYYHKARALEAAGRIEDARNAITDGLRVSKAAGDQHAASELAALLESLE